MSTESSDPRLTALETALARLKPLSGGLDRDQLLFRAGQASVRSRTWLWPGATAAALLLAAGLGLALLRPVPGPAERIVVIREPASLPEPLPFKSTPAEPGLADYLRLRDQVVQRGVESLPLPPPGPAVEPAPSIRSLLDS